METFVLDISRQKQERLKAYIFNLGLLSIPMIYDVVVPNSFIKSSYYFFVGSVAVVNLIKEVFSEKIFQISFDPESQQIGLTSKTLLSKPKRKTISFDCSRLESIDEGSFLIFKGSMRLCFMKNHIEVACIKENTRGFSKSAMNEMIKKAQDYNIPVTIIR